jgi:hypothetical protein
MNTLAFKHRLFVKLFAVGCLMLALLGNNAWAQGGGSPDPAEIPLLKALSVQIASIDKGFQELTAVGGGTPDPADLPKLKTLASRLVEADLHLGLAKVGGGTPDPTEQPLIDALLGLRMKAVTLRGHIKDALAAVGGGSPDPAELPIVNTLKFMLKSAHMVIGRVDYTLSGIVPTPTPDF